MWVGERRLHGGDQAEWLRAAEGMLERGPVHREALEELVLGLDPTVGYRTHQPGQHRVFFEEGEEPGTLRYVTHDSIEFKSQGGDIVLFTPTETPPQPEPCA